MELNPFLITQTTEYSPHIGRLVCMLTYARLTTLDAVEGLTMRDLDHLHDDRSNSIGALLLHMAAVEFSYQRRTLDNRDLDAGEQAVWAAALELGPRGRSEIRGHPLVWYTDQLAAIREQTLHQFLGRGDDWLDTEEPFWQEFPANYHFMWFHVGEDEVNHRGQIRWLRKRLPG